MAYGSVVSESADGKHISGGAWLQPDVGLTPADIPVDYGPIRRVSSPQRYNSAYNTHGRKREIPYTGIQEAHVNTN